MTGPTRTTTIRLVLPLLAAASAALLAPVSVARAAPPPVKEQLAGHFGAKVDATTGANVCTVESKDTCQPGLESSLPGGFLAPVGVAVNNDPTSPQYHDVYVSDVNSRVQVLTPAGAFVLMFGSEVDAITHGNVCTAASGDTCQAGVKGTAPGQFGEATFSVAVDPSTGNVFVQDYYNFRVQEFTATGQFVLMIGKEVDETKDNTPGSTAAERNVCTAASKDTCKAGVVATGSTEPGAFSFAAFDGNLLTVGGPEGLLYVGDEHRVQEFSTATGAFTRELALTSISAEPFQDVHALAVDSAGDVYLTYGTEGTVSPPSAIREFNVKGEQVLEIQARRPADPNHDVRILSIALDAAGRLAVTETESTNPVEAQFGTLYTASTGHLVTEFTPAGGGAAGAGGSKGLAFSDSGDLFAAVAGGPGHEVVTYTPVAVAELLTSPVPCKVGADHESSATFTCSLSGEVNPEGVSENELWFQWGLTRALGTETAKVPVADGAALVPAPAVVVEGLRPNATVFYRLAAFDQNVKPPEASLSSEAGSFATPAVAPRILGEPAASFVTGSSAVFFEELNPENTATRYQFEYGPCATVEGCAGSSRTAVLESTTYGAIGATLEATGLQPGTVYRYRLIAESENAAKTEKHLSSGPEASFETPVSSPEAITGLPVAVSATSAVLTGAVNPAGRPATYTFELGVGNGAGTQYGLVLSGSAGSGNVPLAESFALAGLQPGTTYAYRIIVKAGAGQPIQGQPVIFTTAVLPSALTEPVRPPFLAVPAVAFPTGKVSEAPPRLTRAQQLVRALKACAKKRSRRLRVACRKQAQRKYATTRQANHRKKG